MALGFGFNKAKVLASAEKNVQQGKLRQAIDDYEKIAAKDPKDLTVLNTIGDLYGRLGQNERAGDYFKKVGDAYAADGFTVKAIAMYKKLTKVNPGALGVIQRLAELYTQQGLYNDARQQYLILADSSIKSNDLTGAARIFQKMLEMDPDNASLQSKLADIYVKAGKKAEAGEIFLKAASSLYERRSIEQANESLERILSLDPTNLEALFMRGKIALEAGDGASAVKYLEKIPNIDSRADGLQSLMKGYLLSGDLEHAEAVARKLVSVHNDLNGVRALAEFGVANDNSELALNLYDEFADRLVVGDTGEFTLALQGLTGQLKDSPERLEKLRGVFQKAGASANLPEINELLAHAYVKKGDLSQARDLYKELADLEPSNPQHMQNYQQVQKRMGEEPTSRPLPAMEGSQAFFVEEIDTPIPSSQEYAPALQEKIATALTDSELFESYKKPEQAVKPLETILQKAPRDVRINQRLASIYVRLERYAEAARCCAVLQEVYAEAGMQEESQKYAEMAKRFRQEAGLPEPVAAAIPVEAKPTPTVMAQEETSVPAAVATDAQEFEVMPTAGEAHEIDLSSEWEAATAETMEFPTPVTTQPPEPPSAAAEEPEEVSASVITDLLEEIKFYLSQQMWDEAQSAIRRCESLAPANFQLPDLKAQLQAGLEAANQEAGTVAEYDFEAEMATVAEVDVAAAAPVFEVAPPEFAPEVPVAEVHAPGVQSAAPVAPAELAEPTFQEVEIEAVEVVEEEEEAPATQEAPLDSAVAVEEPAREPEPVMAAAPVVEEDALSDMVSDLENALGTDFGVAPSHEPQVAAAAMAGASASSVLPHAAQMSSASAMVAAPLPEASSSMLSELFAEFKEEVGEAAEEKEDPDTHYNLGVAFKEMGLLDEAIGELQKVCKAIDGGAHFTQVMQAYTWLANCFVEKGVPEAAVKWYEKALSLPSSPESRTALHYDLATTYEAAGDRTLALKHFTEVYGTNIDYRDVAQRIKALKS